MVNDRPKTTSEYNVLRLGLLWQAFEATDTDEILAGRLTRDQLREADPFTADLAALENCNAAFVYIKERALKGASTAELALLADAATRMVLSASRQNPYGEPDLADIQFALVDTLAARAESELCSPRALVALALQLRQGDERAAAEWLLCEAARQLESRLALCEQPVQAYTDLAIVYCGLADVYGGPKERDKRLNAVRRAWVLVQAGNAALKRFVICRYRLVLEDQRRPEELVQAARRHEERLILEAGGAIDWICQARWLVGRT